MDQEQRILGRAIGVLAFGLALSAGLWVISGTTFGLFLGGLGSCALSIPWAAAMQRTVGRQLMLIACITDSTSLIWLAAAISTPQLRLGNWFHAYAVLLSVALLQWGIVRLLQRSSAIIAAAMSTLVTTVWLLAPFWLMPQLSDRWLHALIAVHPVMAVNSATPLSIWTESHIAYQLLNLNQDVFYALPASVWPCVALHAALGLSLICVNVAAAGREHTAEAF